MEKGLLSIVLHAHLPFVRHPEHEYFLEESWLYEAITETYIPLLEVLEGLERSHRQDLRVGDRLDEPVAHHARGQAGRRHVGHRRLAVT